MLPHEFFNLPRQERKFIIAAIQKYQEDHEQRQRELEAQRQQGQIKRK